MYQPLPQLQRHFCQPPFGLRQPSNLIEFEEEASSGSEVAEEENDR